MKSIISLFVFLGLLSLGQSVSAQKPEDTEDWSRKPEQVIPAKPGLAPSDAIILYGHKKDSVNWTHPKGDSLKWKFTNAMTVTAGAGSIESKQSFGDIQLHIEWRAPKKVKGDGQGRGNSGIFLMNRYEVQVLDSYDNETYYNGQAASIYKQHIPLVNACLEPGKWQSYDIFFTAPQFNEDETLKTPAYITVVHNGILVQNHVELWGPSLYIGKPEYSYHPDKLPIQLQDHGNPVSFRNIWVRELSTE